MVNVKQKVTTINTEFIEPGTEVNAKLLINLPNLKNMQLFIGSRRAKGYGLVDVSFSIIK